jgi:hypothetical protein
MRNFFARHSNCRSISRVSGTWLPLLAALFTLTMAPARVDAQVVPGAGSQIGSLAAERARLQQITGRATDSVVPPSTSRAFQPILPTLRLVWNSALPAGGNDGALWAGRGLNASLSGGVSYRRTVLDHPLVVRLEPELDYSQNRPFQLLPGRYAGRSAFSSPWHVGPISADLPLRFGDQSIRTIGLGQSSVTMTTDRVTFGISATNEWWGPALRNTLLLSNNAAGVPRVFARTSQPLRTRYGSFEGRAFIGGLTESPYFDSESFDDTRSLSGLLVTYRPAIDTGLTLGLSRLVMASVPSPLGILPHFLDVLVRYEPMQDIDPVTGENPQSIDQLFSLFARWVFPQSGFETYVEWARMELPRSIREFLLVPQNTQGYTIGLQWANPVARGGLVRLQGEVTYLEQNQVISGRPAQDYYVGRAAVQGFTQRGQILGAAIGPGSSSQFVGGDWIAPRWQAGAFVVRTRTENDALYRQFLPRMTQHDVTLQAGLRAGFRFRDADFTTELTTGTRYNYLFQSDYYLGSPVEAIDIRNLTLSLTRTPR